MSSYKYTAKNLAGKIKEGVNCAISKQEALVALRENGLIPIEVTEVPAKEESRKKLSFHKKIKSSELASFCWQMSTMIEGGIPLITAIETIADDNENEHFKEILKEIVKQIQKGSTLHESIGQFPKVFDNLFHSLVMTGETGGALSTTLVRLAEYYDSRDKLIRQVKTMLAYPLFVVAFMIFLVTFIMTFIIPRFKSIFQSIGGELPLFTKIFMGVYDAIVSNILLTLFIILLIIAGLFAYSKTEKGWRRLSRIILKLPLTGKVKAQAFIAMFCKTFATLLSSGVSVLDALNLMSTMSKNAVIKDCIVSTRDLIVEGYGISMSMSSNAFFPKVLIKMVKVGEESGSLPNVLDRTCSYYERRVESTITTAMSLMEPILIISIGVIVLAVVLALYLPIFTISNIQQ